MAGLSSVYKDDCIEDPAIIAAKAMQQSTDRISIIDGVEVFTQDAEFDLDDDLYY